MNGIVEGLYRDVAVSLRQLLMEVDPGKEVELFHLRTFLSFAEAKAPPVRAALREALDLPEAPADPETGAALARSASRYGTRAGVSDRYLRLARLLLRESPQKTRQLAIAVHCNYNTLVYSLSVSPYFTNVGGGLWELTDRGRAWVESQAEEVVV
jgi:hypothetical protein